jgi:hypothetical protein
MPTPRVILREWGLCIGPYSLESIFLTGLLFRHLTQIKDVSIKVIIETSGSSERERDREREREGGRGEGREEKGREGGGGANGKPTGHLRKT